MQAAGVGPAHVFGVSLGAAVGTWLAAKHPEQVRSLSLHSAWDKTDPFLRVIVEGWRTMAKALDSVTEMVIQAIFPFCLTPELYAARPEYVDSLAEFVRSRPMPPVDALIRQSEAVLSHDATGILGSVHAPTLITYGRHDIVTSTRFAAPLTEAIADTELFVFEDCAHAAIYENVEGFNRQTLGFLAAAQRLMLARWVAWINRAMPPTPGSAGSRPRRPSPTSAGASSWVSSGRRC